MKDNTKLKQLYEGRLPSAERMVWASSEFITEFAKLQVEIDNFKANLNHDLKKQFEKLRELQKEYNAIYAYEDFAYGFKLGLELSKESQNKF